MRNHRVTDRICQHLRSLGLSPKETYAIINQVQKWIDNNGAEWTNDRLKTYRLIHIHRIAEAPFESSWIRKDSRGVPKGPFSKLMHTDTPQGIQRAFSALRVYTVLKNTRVSRAQWKKFISSAEQAFEQPELLPPVPYTPFGVSEIDIREEYNRVASKGIEALPHSPEKRAPIGGLETVPESDVESWLDFSSDLASELSSKSEFFENLLSSVLTPEPSSYEDTISYQYKDGISHQVGKVSFIQEPGLKLRAVANPNRLLQVVLEPLKRSLGNRLKNIEEDCTFEQEKGVRVGQSWLAEGKTVHSIDLSDATNNFPLWYTKRVLISSGPLGQASLRLFYEASRGDWAVDDPEEGERMMTWTKGQPLGLGPSFFAFGLSHHSLARSTLGEGNYQIVGDDIITCVDPEPYLSALQEMGIPVSKDKCLDSDRAFEFAGVLATKDRVFTHPKVARPDDFNFLNYVENLGPSAIQYLPRKQKAVALATATMPTEYGGFGWNPKGLPYHVRMELAESFSQEPEEVVNLQRPPHELWYQVQEGTALYSWLPKWFGDSKWSRPDSMSEIEKSLDERLGVLSKKVPKGSVPPGYTRGVRDSSKPTSRLDAEFRKKPSSWWNLLTSWLKGLSEPPVFEKGQKDLPPGQPPRRLVQIVDKNGQVTRRWTGPRDN